MRSYLKYLSRNKLYTAFIVIGFAVSLMFVIILGSYVRKELRKDQFNKNVDRTYLLKLGNKPSISLALASQALDAIPEVESYCRLTPYRFRLDPKKYALPGQPQLKTLMVDSSFFSIFDFKMLSGDYKESLQAPNGVILTKDE